MAAEGMGRDSFGSSKLGTQKYWDEAYEREWSNYQDSGDRGEVWFGDESMDRIIRWMESSSNLTKSSSILDLGCGNGLLLLELGKAGYSNLTGVDYSEKAITLAQAIAKEEDVQIAYQTCDIVASPLSTLYDVCLDKGTYDAISLNPDNPEEKREKYIQNVHRSLNDNGLLIITSCNWTEKELTQQFNSQFLIKEKIPTPSFSFGGQSGNKETVLVLEKIKT